MLTKALKWTLKAIGLLVAITLLVVIVSIFLVAVILAYIGHVVSHVLENPDEEMKSFGEVITDAVAVTLDDLLSDERYKQHYYWLFRDINTKYDYPCLYYLNRSVWPPFWGHKFKLGEGL